MRRRTLLVALPILSLATLTGLGIWAWKSAPAQAAPPLPPPIRVECGRCPDSIDPWVRVKEFLAWSGCRDWECWSRWIGNDPSNALMELKADRFEIQNPGDPNPPGWPNPGRRGEAVPCPNCSIWDGREVCGDGKAAKGTWYHNAFARPVWRREFEDGQIVLVCSWEVDLSVQHWNFAEDDRCKQQVCLEPTPPMTVTQCYIVETPIVRPTQPPPTPTPFAAVEPSLEAKAFIHSRHDPKDNAYPTLPRFYWNWQEYMDASLTAEITEPTVPGCSVSSEVVAYWFYGSLDWTVCPGNSSDPNCRWRPVYKGGAHPNVDRPEWIHLLWSRTGSAPTRPAAWNFYPVGPKWVDIRYAVLVASTYACGENAYTAYWTKDLTLQVGLLRQVQTIP